MAGDDDLTVERLPTPGAVVTLGTIAVRSLQERGIVTLFVNAAGKIELCPPGELEMDALPEQVAVQVLSERGYGDEQLVAYLKGRDARAAKRQPKPEVAQKGEHGQDL